MEDQVRFRDFDQKIGQDFDRRIGHDFDRKSSHDFDRRICLIFLTELKKCSTSTLCQGPPRQGWTRWAGTASDWPEDTEWEGSRF